MTDRRTLLRGIPLALVATALPARVQAAERPSVAAAPDLRLAPPRIDAAFAVKTGPSVRPVSGSPGALARQIRQSAPFALHLSADEHGVLELAHHGLTRGEG